jgi:hypothetical protein
MKAKEQYKAKMQCKCGNDKFTSEVMKMYSRGTLILELQLTCCGCGRKVRYFAKNEWYIEAMEIKEVEE